MVAIGKICHGWHGDPYVTLISCEKRGKELVFGGEVFSSYTTRKPYMRERDEIIDIPLRSIFTHIGNCLPPIWKPRDHLKKKRNSILPFP